MDSKKKYTKSDLDNYVLAVKKEYEATLIRQRERIDELRAELDAAEKKADAMEKEKSLIYRAITQALKKADDIERVSLIRYNQEIAQLKSFHDKWVGYYNKIIERYPIDDDLIATSKVNGKIADVLDNSGDIEAQYESERARLVESLNESLAAENEEPKQNDYADRSPAGFSFAEALHPKDDLKDIMRELGVIMDEE